MESAINVPHLPITSCLYVLVEWLVTTVCPLFDSRWDRCKVCAGCLDPPVPHSSLLAMIDAFNKGMYERSIQSWLCAICMRVKQMKAFLPISAHARNGKVARHVSTDKTQARQRGTKHLVDGRENGWRDRVPAVQIPSRPIAQTGSSAGAWPPVRQKRDVHAPTVLKESPGRSTDAKVKVAPSGAVGINI